MKKILVIGANSYIGKKFYEYVKRENEMQIDMVKASDGGWNNIDFSRYDSILHLAAIVHKKENKNMKDLYYKVNYKLAVEVAEKAKKNAVGHFVFMSTAAVYGNETKCITSDTLPKPVTLYGKSKLAAEKEIIKLKDTNFKIAIVRPPMVYGEGCKGNYARLEMLSRFTPIFPEYHNKRSKLHIDNLIRYLYNVISLELMGYYHPQDNEYLDTCLEVVKIRGNMKKRTKLLRGVELIINLCMINIRPFKQLFGDFYYDYDIN